MSESTDRGQSQTAAASDQVASDNAAEKAEKPAPKKTAAKKKAKKASAKPAASDPAADAAAEATESKRVIKRSPKKAGAAAGDDSAKPSGEAEQAPAAAGAPGAGDKPAAEQAKAEAAPAKQEPAAADAGGDEAKPAAAEDKPKPKRIPPKRGLLPSKTPQGPAARLAAEAAAARKAAGETEATPEATPSAEDEANAARRKVRRSRTAEGGGRRRRSRRAAGDEDTTRQPGQGGRTAPGSRGGGAQRPRGGSAMDRLLATPRRTIYRQDLGDDSPPPSARDRAKAEAEARTKAKAAAAAKAKEADKITLLLHPAPKAAGFKKKAANRPKTAKEALRAKSKKGKKGKQARPSKKGAAKPIKLQDAWLKAGSDDAVAAAQAAGNAGEALVKAWLGQDNVDAIVATAHDKSIVGKTRKAARRAVNVLRSRGVEVPDAPNAQAEEQGPQVETVATFVPPDGSGVLFFSITRHQPGSRFHVADAVIQLPLGIVQASSGRLAGKQIRAWRTRVEEHFGASPVQVPLEWARYRIAEARRLNDTSKTLLPLGFDRCAELFDPSPEDQPVHPMADLEAGVDEASIDAAKPNSDKLHNEPEFRSWMPTNQALQELLIKVGERVGPDGVNDSKQVDEALKEEIVAATDRFFSPERREALALQMHDSAISVRTRAGEAEAGRVLAVARAVKEAGLITSPPSEIPFLVAYFQKAVAIMLQQQNGMLRVPVPQAQADAAAPA